jgi:hypothetical protein
MKTIKNILPIFILALLIMGNTAEANNNTKCNHSRIVEITLSDEAYINDIPFDTSAIFAEANDQEAFQGDFPLEDESYIDDIPFDTKSIACSVCNKLAEETHFPLEEEAYINDIPFNTALIVAVIKAQQNLLAQR